MSWKVPIRLAKPRFPVRSLIVLIAIIAACMGIWREFWSPRRVWRRAIHAPKLERIVTTDPLHGSPINPPRHVFERSVPWPIQNLRIDGLDEAGSLEELELAMSDPDPALRKEVYWLVVNGTPPSDPAVGIRLLAPGLEDRDELVRAAAVRGLGKYVLSDKPFPPRFFGMLDDPSPLVRRSAVEPICVAIDGAPDTSAPGRDHLNAVLSRLEDPDPFVQATTIEALESLLNRDPRLTGPGAAGAGGRAILDALQKKLGDPKRGIRGLAAYVLASYGRGLDAVPMLIDLHKRQYDPPNSPGEPPGPSWGGRWPVETLALLADRSDEAASVLFDRLNTFTGHPTGSWQSLAGVAGRSLEGRARIERLAIQRLGTQNTYVDTQLALILQAIGSSRDVLPELIEGITDHDEFHRRDCIQALMARLALDPRILPRLREAARRPLVYEAERAALALKEIESMSARPVSDAKR